MENQELKGLTIQLAIKDKLFKSLLSIKAKVLNLLFGPWIEYKVAEYKEDKKEGL